MELNAFLKSIHAPHAQTERRAEAGTYLEHKITGHNIHSHFIATQDEADRIIALVNAQYSKYGTIHTMKTRTVVIGDWS